MTTDTTETATALPKPIALTPEQLLQIAAGTAALLPIAVYRPILAGPLPPGPIWENPTVTVAA